MAWRITPRNAESDSLYALGETLLRAVSREPFAIVMAFR
jgi:hypothetical protein